MCQLNKLGLELANIEDVTAMTDVTGFGLLGHLTEICRAADLQATVAFSQIAKLPYIEQGCVPSGTQRNFASYGHFLSQMTPLQCNILCDPHTSGGLLMAVLPTAITEVKQIALQSNLTFSAIGQLEKNKSGRAMIEVIE